MPKKYPRLTESRESNAERVFMSYWTALNLMPLEDAHSQPVREYKFDGMRNWRFDFAWPMVLVAVEIEGGVYVNGGHTRPAGYQKDCEKYNKAIELGWRVLRFTPQMVEANPIEVIRQIERVLQAK